MRHQHWNRYIDEYIVPIVFKVATKPDILRPVSFTMSEGECSSILSDV